VIVDEGVVAVYTGKLRAKRSTLQARHHARARALTAALLIAAVANGDFFDFGFDLGGRGGLSVQRIGGDHRSGQVDVVQQCREQRDIVGVGLDVGLTQDHAVLVIEGGGRQMPTRTIGRA
jgi:hypothetical protein